MTDNGFKYWVFLSCSREDNCERRADSPEVGHRCWGNCLQDALTSFSIPAEFVGQINGRGEIIPERIAPFFQDEPELLEAATLSADVRKALEQSVCLVVVCSPRSAQSRQVNEAVRYFKQLGRGKNILPIVIAGEPNAGDGNQPGRSSEDECFVPALRHPVSPDGTLDTARRTGKAIFVDARHGVEKREILANDHRAAEADLEMAKIQLIALLLSVGFNGLWWREQRRHFFDFAEARRSAREALNQVEEFRRQLQETQRQADESRSQALATQNLPREVHGQIQEAQNLAKAAQNQAHEAEKRLQELQNKVRDTQAQLEAARDRALTAESRVREAQNQAREFQSQLEDTRRLAREAQDKVLEIQTPSQDISSRIQEAQNQTLKAQGEALNVQSQLEEARQQAGEAHIKFAEAQSRVQEFQNLAQSAQGQLADALDQVRESQSKILEAQNQAGEAQKQVQTVQNKIRNQRRLARVLALLAVLALGTAGTTIGLAWRQHKAANQALVRAVAEVSGNFDLNPDGEPPVEQVLQTIAGAEQARNRRHSLDRVAAEIPRSKISEALQASAVIVDDQERSHFQKWLLVRLGWVNPESAMACASAIEGNIVNDEGAGDSILYFQLAVLDNWMKTDFPGAFNWICQLPDADTRQRALEKIIEGVQSHPDSESKNQTLATCIEELAKTDVSQALTLAESLPAVVWRNQALSFIAEQVDLSAALDWSNHIYFPEEIMQPRNALSPWTKFLFELKVGRSVIFPIETEFLLNAKPDPTRIEPQA